MTSPQQNLNPTGLDKKTSAILSYALGWLTGIVFLILGKHDPDVRFHAAQSIVFFGAVSVLNIVLSILGSLLGAIGIILSLAGFALAVFAAVVWVMAMLQANRTGGVRAELPIVGKFVAPYADRLAGAAN
ncbi:DUF4870 domain-containing protein [Nocardia jiangsuensis]|uniref:DUF4870 domain-containing protein n=1 Tax=Nocardia jiangsuensis TaxID=1691563 RepID=A0ABV8DXZ8_9NOCA